MKAPEKILFVGLGGAGQRHARIFRSLLPGAEFTAYRARRTTPLLHADFSLDGDAEVESRYGLRPFQSLEAALDDHPDLAVIATPTALHMAVARQAAERGIGLFVEKPLSHDLDGVAELREAVARNALPFMVSFQRRFHPLIARARSMIAEGIIGKIVSASFTVASYVPAWHPYEDFRSLYAVRRDLGGGVLLTEIHEIDLCAWFFGPPETVYCNSGTFGGVPMDVEDTAQISLRYPDFAVRVDLCFMQRRTGRSFAVAGTDGHLEWSQDGNVLIHEDYLREKRTETADPDFPNDAMFLNQARYLFGPFDPAVDTGCYLDAAALSLEIVAAAKRSMTTGRAEPVSAS